MAQAEGTERQQKYAPLGEHLKQLAAEISVVTFRFDDIEGIIGDELPPSATLYREWWANQDGGSRSPHWRAAGFKVDQVDLSRKVVTFRRLVPTLSQTARQLTLQEVMTEVNQLARDWPIGGLQEWRKERHGNSRLPSSTLFAAHPEEQRDYAFHWGGLTELQFNVGFEPVGDVRTFRHGAAFSLQPTRELPEIGLLIPKIERFNEYLRIYPDAFDGLSMWHWSSDGRSDNYPVAPIPDRQVKKGFFIFIGRLQPADGVIVDLILEDFDRLLPVYQYVEGTEAFPKAARDRRGFVWSPGNKARVFRSTVERTAQTVEKPLRHNRLQDALFSHPEEIHGPDNTSGEQNCGIGMLIDVAVRDGEEFVYYEIKTGLSAQACIREAFGQLMEYSYWPGSQRADRLVIVGEQKFDPQAREYIEFIRTTFSLPIEYRQFDMDSGRLV